MKKGFTFLELLVAMALMNIIAAALYASLYAGFKARNSAKQATEPMRAAQIAIGMLQSDLEAAQPPKGILAGEFLGVNNADDGDMDWDTLTFYTSNHNPYEGETACDIRKVELAIAESEEDELKGLVLVRRITTNLLSPKTLEPIEEVLCRGVTSFNLRYLDGFEWLDEWDSIVYNDTLPKAVEVTIGIEQEPGTEEDEDETSEYKLTQAFIIPCSGTSSGGEGRAAGGAAPGGGSGGGR
jgi:type II secretion system protein J